MDKILGSSVIVAMIAFISSLIMSSKQNRLQYITAERKEWRERIRYIEKRLGTSSYKETLQIINELKANINSYGKDEKIILKDSHIWDIIEKIESTNYNMKNLGMDKKKLIDYIVLLLKYDWERSKKETQLNTVKFLSAIMYILCVICIVLNLTSLQFKLENVIIDYFAICICAILMILFNYWVPKLLEKNLNNKIGNETKYKNKSNIVTNVLIVCFGLIVIYLIEAFIFFVMLSDFNKIKSGDYSIAFILYILGLYAQLWNIFDELDDKFKYITKVVRTKNLNE